MPVIIPAADAILYLQQFLQHNKARGMVAELALSHELGIVDSPVQQKLLPGGWFLSPKIENFHTHRYVVFMMPLLYENEAELQSAVRQLEYDRGWQALATFLSVSGIGIIVSGAWTAHQTPDLNMLSWRNFVYKDERLKATQDDAPFISWPGNRGRASKGTEWQADVKLRFEAASNDDLTALAMRQAFYYGYLKQRLKKPLEDPYDVDAFIVSFSGVVMPVEIKEKSPTAQGSFGIDAGRILMLLRLCLATDSNALYLIREVDSGADRDLIAWRYITLADIIMSARWKSSGRGRGHGWRCYADCDAVRGSLRRFQFIQFVRDMARE